MSEAEIASQEAFANLLSQGDILQKILVHLVDSGLHECRRVCRQWHAVCNTLPVKVRFEPNTVAASTAQQFSNVVSLKVIMRAAAGLVEGQNFLHNWTGTITHLDLAFLYDSLTPPLIGVGLVSSPSLRSLSIKLSCRDPLLFVETLRCLSNLTALRLDGVIESPVNMHPFADLHELRSLTAVPNLLVNANGELLFASTAQLTRIEILPPCTYGYQRVCMERILPSVPNLLSLTVGSGGYRNVIEHDWDILRTFIQLEQLTLKGITLDATCFVETIGDLCSLTELAILNVQFSAVDPVIDAILAKTTLVALTFNMWSQNGSFCVKSAGSDMTQLTRLSWQHPSIFSGMCSMHKMVHFDGTTGDVKHTRKLVWMVENMSELQSLEIENGGRRSFLPNRVFLQTTNLRSLTIKGFYLDRTFFEALATLRSLTELCLDCYKSRRGIPLIEFFTGLNLLTSLRELMLITRPPHPVLLLDDLSGDRLRGLQVLRLPSFKPTADQLNSLFRRLPSLRQFFCKSTTICCMPDASVLKLPSSS